MIYLSNLDAPNLTPYFRHLHSRVQGHSFGHEVPSDWADKADDDPVFGLYKRCGMLTHDEGAIVWNIAESIGGHWLDLGCHTGWSTAHILFGAAKVIAVDPMMWNEDFYQRFSDNMSHTEGVMPWAGRSEQLFDLLSGCPTPLFDGVLIDGDHMAPHPLEDARGAHDRLQPGGVILLHDLMGGPVQEAAVWLMDRGYKCRAYCTPHMMACCWRGDWQPPEHVPDPAIDWQEIRTNHMKEFPWSRCA